MNRYTAILIDDEEPGRRNLSALLEKYCPEIEVIAEAANAAEAKEKILSLGPNVLFLDINMPELNGFDLLESLNKKDFAVVFVTAHKDYGIQAVKAGAIDYILKPIVIKELQQAVNKIVSFYDQKKSELVTENQKPGRITLSHTGGFSVIEMKDIIRLEAESNYTRVYVTEKRSYFVSKPLKVFEDSLKDNIFFRVHRSYIINLNHVKEFLREDGGVILMNDDARIQLPKARYNEFIEAMRRLSIAI
ncbi:MAG: LytTR family DNA-binding domain-containing protein [Chitinophagales bacterium]